MIHTILIAPYFGGNMRHCLRCFADLPDCKLGVLSQEPEDKLPPEVRGILPNWDRPTRMSPSVWCGLDFYSFNHNSIKMP